MKRETTSLKSDQFDLLIIGAGIHGSWVARDASLRGLKVAIIDQGDLGSGTSHNSLKTIHGGIRYLQHLNFKRTIESIREQNILREVLSHLVRPVPFIMPLYGYGMRGPEAMWTGLQIYYAMCKLLRTTIPRGFLLTRNALLKRAPDVSADNLTGGACWEELQISFADRAIIELLHDAHQFGGNIANYVSAQKILTHNNKAVGATVYDSISEETFEIKAKSIINATGPWLEPLLQQSGKIALPVPLTKSMNLVLNREWNGGALGIQSNLASDSRLGKSKRLYFMVPWEGKCIAGTTHFPYQGDPGALATNRDEINEFINELNIASPRLNLSPEDVLYCYQGLTPAVSEGESSIRLDHSTVVDHSLRDGISDLYSIIGIKWTTARLVAETAVDMVCTKREQTASCETSRQKLPELDKVTWRIEGLTQQQLEKFCVQHIQNTMAVNLSDILLRRCNDVVTGRASADTILAVARTMATLLGWTEQQLEQQMQEFLKAPIAASLRTQLKL